MIFNSPNSQQKNLQYPKSLPVATHPTISEVGRALARNFESDSLNHESRFGNYSYLH